MYLIETLFIFQLYFFLFKQDSGKEYPHVMKRLWSGRPPRKRRMGTVQSVTWRVRTSVTARATRWVTSAMAMGTKGVQRTSSGRFKCPKRLSLKLSVIFVKKINQLFWICLRNLRDVLNHLNCTN